MTRKKKWSEFFARRAQWQARHFGRLAAAPAFVQEVVKGLWAVQELVTPPLREYGTIHRMLCDPPDIDQSEPYYNGWPGDYRRGWMHFESKEAARDFYKFATRRITFEEFRKLPHAPPSNVRIAMDARGDFTEQTV